MVCHHQLSLFPNCRWPLMLSYMRPGQKCSVRNIRSLFVTTLLSFYIISWSLEHSSFSFCDTINGMVVFIILWSHHCRHNCNYCNHVIETFLSYEYCIHFVSSTAYCYRTTTLCMSFRIKHHFWSLWSLWLGPVKLGSSVRLLCWLRSFRIDICSVSAAEYCKIVRILYVFRSVSIIIVDGGYDINSVSSTVVTWTILFVPFPLSVYWSRERTI